MLVEEVMVGNGKEWLIEAGVLSLLPIGLHDTMQTAKSTRRMWMWV